MADYAEQVFVEIIVPIERALQILRGEAPETVEGWIPPRRRCGGRIRELLERAERAGTPKACNALVAALGERGVDEVSPAMAVPVARALVREDDIRAVERHWARVHALLSWAAHAVLGDVCALADNPSGLAPEWEMFHADMKELAARVRDPRTEAECLAKFALPYMPWLLALQRRGVGGRHGLGVLGGTPPADRNQLGWPMPTPTSEAWAAWDAAMEEAANLAAFAWRHIASSKDGYGIHKNEHGVTVLRMPSAEALKRALKGDPHAHASEVRTYAGDDDDRVAAVGMAILGVEGIGPQDLAQYWLWLRQLLPPSSYGESHYYPPYLQDMQWPPRILDAISVAFEDEGEPVDDAGCRKEGHNE